MLGLLFIVMGTFILLYPRIKSEYELSNILYLFGLFSVFHGVKISADMWNEIFRRKVITDFIVWLGLLISYIFLFEFGRHLIKLILKQKRRGKFIVKFLNPFLAPTLLVMVFLVKFAITDTIEYHGIWARVFLGIPGGALASFGMLLYFKDNIQKFTLFNIRRYFYIFSASFLLYTALSLMVYSPDIRHHYLLPFREVLFINSRAFSVDFYRLIIVGFILWSVSGIMKIFILEKNFKLAESKQLLKNRLEEAEKRYADIADNSNDMIHTVDKNYRILFSNKTERGKLGYTEEELLGKNALETLYAPEVRELMKESFTQLITEGTSFVPETTLLKKNGERIYVSANAIAVYDEAGNLVRKRTILKDLTEIKKVEEEKKELERQMLKNGKLTSIGKLAAVIAHELNNPLTAILGFTRLMKESLEGKTIFADDLNKVETAAIRCQRVVEQLHLLLRSQKMPFGILNIPDVLKNTEALLKLQLQNHNIKTILEIPRETIYVKGDEYQLSQLFTNLLVNSKDAMPKGGTLTISVQKMSVGELLTITEKKLFRAKKEMFSDEKEFAVIKFSDTGTGMDEKTVRHVFDEFYTTKKPHEGIGLGLPICQNIVSRHDGYIDISSVYGKGTTVTVMLPISMI